ALNDAGLHMVAGTEESDAALIRESAIGERLLAALDEYSFLLYAPTFGVSKGMRIMNRIAMLAEADPILKSIRKSTLDDMSVVAEKMLDDPDNFARLSPSLIVTLGLALKTRERQEKWWRTAHVLHPSDFDISVALMLYFHETERFVEALGMARVTVALRPSTA